MLLPNTGIWKCPSSCSSHHGLNSYYHWICQCLFWLGRFSSVFHSCITAASSVAVAIYPSKHVFPVTQIVNVIVAHLVKIFWWTASSVLFSNFHCVRPPEIQTWYNEHVTCHGILCTQHTCWCYCNSNHFLTRSHLPTLRLWRYSGEMMVCLTGRQI